MVPPLLGAQTFPIPADTFESNITCSIKHSTASSGTEQKGSSLSRQCVIETCENLSRNQYQSKQRVHPSTRNAAYRIADNTLIPQILTHALDQLDLFLRRQTVDGHLHQASHRRLVRGNETVIIHVHEETHDELAIHAVRHAAVARNGVTKVLDLESALQTRCKESTEGSNERGECGDKQGMNLDRGNGEAPFGGEVLRRGVRVR